MRVQCIQWKWGKWKTTEHEISTQENLNAMELFYTCLKYPSCFIGYIRIVKMPIQKHMMHHWFVELVQLFLNFHYPVQKGYRHIFIFDTHLLVRNSAAFLFRNWWIMLKWSISSSTYYNHVKHECTSYVHSHVTWMYNDSKWST